MDRWVRARLWKRLAFGTFVALLALQASCSREGTHRAWPCALTIRPGDSIQAVLNQAPPGAVICLEAGTWAENLTITKPVVLRGAGPSQTVVRGVELARPVVTVGPMEVPGEVALVGLGMTSASGSCGDPLGCAHGLLVHGEARVAVENCAFSGNGADGVQVRGKSQVRLSRVTIADNTGYGLRVVDEAMAQMEGGALSGNRNGGIWLSDAAKLELHRSEVARSGRTGIWLRDRADLSGEGSRVVQSGGHGVWAQGQAVLRLSQWVLSDNRDTGLLLEDSVQASVLTTRIEKAWYGVEVRSNARLEFTGCVVQEMQWDGVRVGGRASAQVVGCTLRQGNGSGISVSGQPQVEVRDNRIERWRVGLLALAVMEPQGANNILAENGVDLLGNLSGSLRKPRQSPAFTEVVFPHRQFRNLQEAVDALFPEGRLVVKAGVYPAGITIDKPVRIEGSGAVLLTGVRGREAPVISIVGGAKAELVGISVGYGGEGVVLGGTAEARFVDCVISDNLEGVRLADSARASLLHCRLSRNERGAVWAMGNARVHVEACVLTANGVAEEGTRSPGLGIGGQAQATIVRSTITESGKVGVQLKDLARVELWENAIVANFGPGVELVDIACGQRGYRFAGQVTGGGNEIARNFGRDVCPEELTFLTSSGGAYPPSSPTSW